MSGRPRVPAYVAFARSYYDHYLWKKDENKPWHWDKAWGWILTHANWRQHGQRMSRGVADVGRGQIAVTIRGLSKKFNWSVGAARYFLRRLVEDGMVTLDVVNTKISTSSGPRKSYRTTLITICNYEKFQGALKATMGGTKQSLTQSQNARLPQLPGLIYPIASEPSKQAKPSQFLESEQDGAVRFEARNRPRHGQRWKNKVFCHFEHADWQDMADDFEAVRRTKPFPTRYLDGKGRWFVNNGEGTQATA